MSLLEPGPVWTLLDSWLVVISKVQALFERSPHPFQKKNKKRRKEFLMTDAYPYIRSTIIRSSVIGHVSFGVVPPISACHRCGGLTSPGKTKNRPEGRLQLHHRPRSLQKSYGTKGTAVFLPHSGQSREAVHARSSLHYCTAHTLGKTNQSPQITFKKKKRICCVNKMKSTRVKSIQGKPTLAQQ